ncbi:MAG: hypothetical protein ACT4P2_11050 [Pseudomonadota bacterium]
MCGCLIAATALAAALWAAPLFAHQGHAHGQRLEPIPADLAAPRAEARSDDFELVAVAADGKLVIYIDRLAGNRPVAGAEVGLSIDGFQVPTEEADEGTYVAAGWAPRPGRHNLIVAVVAGESSDLLTTTLDIPAFGAAGGAAAGVEGGWALALAIALMLAALTLVVSQSRLLDRLRAAFAPASQPSPAPPDARRDEAAEPIRLDGRRRRA